MSTAREQRIAAASLLRGACDGVGVDWKGRVKVPLDVLRKVVDALERSDSGRCKICGGDCGTHEVI